MSAPPRSKERPPTAFWLPQLLLVHWLLLAAFLLFYGFAVFALTRDYYLRHPPGPGVTQRGGGAAIGEQLRTALAQGSSSLPPELVATDPLLLAQEAERLFAMGRFAAAVPLYERVLELVPENAEARNDLGLALHYAGNSARGREVLQAGTERSPGFQRIWLSLGFVAAQSEQPEIARAALARARELDPDNPVGEEAARLLEQLARP